jgi:Mrp family chromosome partitioning ATPase
MSRNFELLQQLNGLPAAHPDAMDVFCLPNSGTAAEPATRVIPTERVATSDLSVALNAEELRLVQRLFLDVKPSPKVVVFSALDAGSGCTYLCARAAELLAEKTDKSVCVVDANLRNASLHRFFDVANSAGLADALLDSGELRSYAHQVGQGRLWLVTAGTEVPDAHTLLGSTRLAGYIAELRRNFDYVLIDSPAASLYTDSVLLGSMADGVALVMKANVSRRSAASKIVEDFSAARVRVLGAVLNQRTFPVPQAIYSRL